MFYAWRCKYGRGCWIDSKRSDEVEMICSMEELMNSMHQHELVEGDYGTHFTTDKVNKISFHSCLLHCNLKKWFCNIVRITLCRSFLREKTYLNGSIELVMDLVLLLSLLGLTYQMESKGERHVLLGFERGGSYRKYKDGLEVSVTGTRKCQCPFKLWGKPVGKGQGWVLKIICGTHNHDLNDTLVTLKIGVSIGELLSLLL